MINETLEADRAYRKDINEAYQRGFDDGKEYGLDEADMREAVSYQKGLSDAWEIARKIVFDSDEGGIRLLDFPTIFGNRTIQQVFRKNSAAEAIAKLKAYKEKQKANNEIKVGDEICYIDESRKDTGIVTWRRYDDIYIMWNDGSASRNKVNNYRKTGRRFGIDKILEEMNGANY